MRFHDFPAQRQTQTCAGCLGRIERQQRIAQHVLRQACAAVGDLNHKVVAAIVHRDRHVIRP
jgi:hypothetical protein